jgi:hypothetical protein
VEGTDIIHLRPLCKLWLSLRRFLRNSHSRNICTEYHTKSARTLENTRKSFFMPFTIPTFMKLIITDWHRTDIFCSEFCLDLSGNLEITSTNLLTPLSEVWLSLRQFSRNAYFTDNLFIKISCSEFDIINSVHYSHSQLDSPINTHNRVTNYT